MFRATMCPSSGENTLPMRHLVVVTLYRWLECRAPCIPDNHIYRVTNTRCHRGTVFSPDDGNTVARNKYRKATNILRKSVHQVGSIYKGGGEEWRRSQQRISFIHTLPICVSWYTYRTENTFQFQKFIKHHENNILRVYTSTDVRWPDGFLSSGYIYRRDVRTWCSQRGRTNYTNFVGNFYFRTVNIALSVSKQINNPLADPCQCTRNSQ